MIKGKNYRQIVFTSATSIDTWIEPGFEKASTKKAWTPRSSGIDSLHWVPVLWVPAGYWRPSVKYNYLLRDRRPPPYRFTDRQEYIGSTRHWINMHWLLDRLLDRVCGLKPGIEPWHWVPVLTPGWWQVRPNEWTAVIQWWGGKLCKNWFILPPGGFLVGMLLLASLMK